MLAFVVAGGCARGRSELNAEQCGPLAISAVDTVRTTNGATAYVESPELLVRNDELVMIGGPAFAIDSTGVPLEFGEPGSRTNQLAGVRIPLVSGRVSRESLARPILLPVGMIRMDTPRAMLDRRSGDIIALWREGALYPETDTARAVWSAVLRDSTWTEPTELLAATTGAWWDLTLTSRTAEGVESSWVLVPINGARGDTMFTIVAHSTKLEVRRTRAPRQIYTAAVSDAPDAERVIAVYVAAGPRVSNSMYSMESADGGKSWQGGALIDSLQVDPAYAPLLLRDAGNQLTAIWTEVDERRLVRTLVRATRRTTDRRWTVTRRQGFEGIDLRSDAVRFGNAVVVATGSGRSDRERLSLLVSVADGWSEIVVPPIAGVVLGSPRLVALTPSRLLVVWSTQTAIGELGAPPVVNIGTIEIACRDSR